jgi:RNA polymerase sigma factor (sigma-70 family)
MMEHAPHENLIKNKPEQKEEGTRIIALRGSQCQKEEKEINRHLWFGLKMGSEEAFRELFLKFNKLLTNYGFSLINEASIVEDCIHDLFLYIWINRDSLGDVESVKYYLIVSYRRRIFKFLKEKEKSKKLLEGIKYEYPKNEDFFENKYVNNVNALEKETALIVAVELLPERQKEVLNLRFVEGMSYNEITLKMGISCVSARKLASKAIKNLRKKLL